ncbi:Arsenite efflux transporter like [Fusarium napiforme]|uniref:Arsenite efflux transporter like n=1 Tax=Fusarium napiforme TaxID=42672 RepID=A0A8H5IFP9_9HYPO|nr:Arsenite efflux transporter like [Fusarium napiforme]
MVVSSSTTNLILVETFKIGFIDYTANMAVPACISAAILFTYLLYIVFGDEKLIPMTFTLPIMSEGQRSRISVNPNLRIMRAEEGSDTGPTTLEEDLNPFVDRPSAGTGTLMLVATIITLLVLDATGVSNGEHTVFCVAPTAPDAGNHHQSEDFLDGGTPSTVVPSPPIREPLSDRYPIATSGELSYLLRRFSDPGVRLPVDKESADGNSTIHANDPQQTEDVSLQSLASDLFKWLQATFPTTMAVLAVMPFEIIPFTLCMFVLVEALVNNG